MDTEAFVGSKDDFSMQFILAVLATWRVTNLLANEDGPADIIVRVRSRLGHGILGSLMDCFECISLWVAAPAALLLSRHPLMWVVSWLAISGGACLLQRLGEKPVVIERGPQPPEGDDDVLR